MFAPSQDDVRRFFCEAHRKQRDGAPMTPLETLAADWIAEHPEYHADLADVNAALSKVYEVEAGRTNPFLLVLQADSCAAPSGLWTPN